MESRLQESLKGHAALEERHAELARANDDMAIEVKVPAQQTRNTHATYLALLDILYTAPSPTSALFRIWCVFRPVSSLSPTVAARLLPPRVLSRPF